MVSNPHFSIPSLTWVQIFLIFVLSITLIYPYFTKRNKPALLLGFASLFAMFGYISVLLPVVLSPENIALQGWFANVVGEAFWSICYAIFAIVILSTQFPKVPTFVAVLIFFVNMSVVISSAISFQEPTIMLDGSLDFHRSFLADFVPFLNNIFLVFGLGWFFLAKLRQGQNVFAISSIMVVTGLAFFAISSPLFTVSSSQVVSIVMHGFSVIGVTLMILGFWVASYQNRSKLKNAN